MSRKLFFEVKNKEAASGTAGKGAGARPPGARGGRGTCQSPALPGARPAPCSARGPQAAQIPPAEEIPTDRAQSQAAPASPLALPEAPGTGRHQGWGPSPLIPPCPPASHHSSARSGPQALGGIKPQAFAECWRFALLCTALLGGSRMVGHSLGAQRPG